MGTHPIFESDFDCLTDYREWDVQGKQKKSVKYEKKRNENGEKRKNEEKKKSKSLALLKKIGNHLRRKNRGEEKMKQTKNEKYVKKKVSGYKLFLLHSIIPSTRICIFNRAPGTPEK